MFKASKYIWITWESQRRNVSMSQRLGAELYQWNVSWPPFLRYPLLSVATVFTIVAKRPKVVFVQNPSVVLAIIAGLSCKVLRLKLVVDAHNGGLFPFEGKNPWAMLLARLALVLADHTIVSNSNLAKYVAERGRSAIVVPDPLPHFVEMLDESTAPRASLDKKNVLFICTWAEDEPYLAVIAAAKRLNSNVDIRVTGNYMKRSDRLPPDMPDNVKLLGFIDEQTYVDELRHADIAMDLTTRNDCLVCGAYESVALNIPVILSDTEATRSYFSRGVVYTKNDEASIATAIDYAVTAIDRLKIDVSELHRQIDRNWQRCRVELESHL